MRDTTKMHNDDLVRYIVAAFITLFGTRDTITLYGFFKINQYHTTPIRLAVKNLVDTGIISEDIRLHDVDFLKAIGRMIPHYCHDYPIKEIEFWG